MLAAARSCVTSVITEKRRSVRAAWLPLALVLALSGSPFAWAGRDIGHDEALYLVEQGVILPLQTLIDDALRRFPGRFLEAELEWDDGRYVYEIEIVAEGRRVIELEYDAVTGQLLGIDEDD
ncbi:peptidase [Pseudomonas sp. WN033]|nr:peptidase [Pseudomonas sp. WN033]